MNYDNHKNITVNQHYVPRCYMKNFATVIGTGRKEKALIVFYQFDIKLLSDKVPTKTICYEKYFYGEDCVIEHDFAQKETNWGITLQKVSQSEDDFIDVLEEQQIKDFAVYQFGRTLAMFKHGKETMEEMITSHLYNTTSEIDENTIRNMVTEKIDKELDATDIVHCCNEILGTIDDLKISIIRYETKEKLITSDMPVVMMNPLCSGKAGMSNVGVLIFFPVSPDTLIIIHDSKIYSIDKFLRSYNEEDVKHLNKYQVIGSEERILANEPNELSTYIEDDNLLNDRDEYRCKRKVASGYDGRGTFMAAKSRALDYKYELSFCKLPRALRKISKECRDAFTRTYSREARLNLLCSVYRIPGLLKSSGKLDAIEIAKRKDGYSKMQKFMDDYWQVPVEDRTITPEFMYKLKTVPCNFYPIDKQ